MSQYPPPYSPQQPPYGNYPQPTADQLLAPARRAGILMVVLGVLFVFCGLCIPFATNTMMNNPEFSSSPEFAEARKQFEAFEQQSGMSMQKLFLIAGAVPLAMGAVFGALGFFVRGGGFVPVIIAIMLSAMLLMFLGLGTLGVLVQSAGNPAALAGVCFYIVPFALVVLLVVWLIQAARAASQVTGARQLYQAQVMQYQQYQEAYRQNAMRQGYPQVPPPQQGMGYPYAPPPAQPPVVPPPAGTQQSPPAPRDPTDGTPPQG